MSDNNHANGSGAPRDDDSGSAGSQNPPPEDSKKSVDYDTYSRAVDREKRWKQEAKEAQDRLAALENERKRNEQEQLEQEGKWQQLAESRQAQIDELKGEVSLWQEKYTGLDGQIKDSKKAHAIASKLPGTLRQEYYHMLDLDSVVMNPETGEIDEASAVKAASVFQEKFPELVRPANTPSLPNGEPKIGSERMVTPEEYRKAPLAEKRKILNEGRLKRSTAR